MLKTKKRKNGGIVLQKKKKSKYIVMNLPNFDKDIFKEITGIDVNKFVGKKG